MSRLRPQPVAGTTCLEDGVDTQDITDALAALGAREALVTAAQEGRIATLTCAMPTCLCPDGRGHFERARGRKNAPWAPSPDRWPVPGREGGTYVPTNVRLAHNECNRAEGIAAWRASPIGQERMANMGREAMARLNATWGRTPEGVEMRRRNGRALNEWLSSTEEGRVVRERNALAASARGRIGGPIGGPKGMRTMRETWGQSPEARQVWSDAGRKGGSVSIQQFSLEDRSNAGKIGGRVAMCARWNIARQKPCVCGRHTDT